MPWKRGTATEAEPTRNTDPGNMVLPAGVARHEGTDILWRDRHNIGKLCQGTKRLPRAKP